MKYKMKYIELKNQLGGNPFRVIPNSGANTSFTLMNQCMWFSIRDFLRLNGYPDISVETIRGEAGLGQDTIFTMFDFENAIFRDALQRISNKYNLRIRVFPVTYEGKISPVWYHPDTDIPEPAYIMTPNNGASIIARKDVNIAQYGIGHFELIVGGYGLPELVGAVGQEFVPAIPVKTTDGKVRLKQVTELSDKETITAALYQEMFDKINLRQFLNTEIEKNKAELKEKNKYYEQTQESKDLTEEEKKIILLSIKTMNIAPFEELNKTFETKSAALTTEINELQAEIDAIEK
jgi:hypothetical protein